MGVKEKVNHPPLAPPIKGGEYLAAEVIIYNIRIIDVHLCPNTGIPMLCHVGVKAGSFKGKFMINDAPLPLLSTWMVASMSSSFFFTMESPNPVPVCLVV